MKCRVKDAALPASGANTVKERELCGLKVARLYEHDSRLTKPLRLIELILRRTRPRRTHISISRAKQEQKIVSEGDLIEQCSLGARRARTRRLRHQRVHLQRTKSIADNHTLLLKPALNGTHENRRNSHYAANRRPM